MEDDDAPEDFNPIEIVEPWYDCFVESEYHKGLNEQQKNQSWGVIGAFASHAFDHIGTQPKHWDVSTVEECCLEILPRKITADSSFFEAVGPVLAAFFRYLDAEKLLPKAVKLASFAQKISSRIVEMADDSSNWGMAKTLFMGAIEAGVDVTDQEALNRYMVQCNQRLLPRQQQHYPDAPSPSPAYHPPVPIRRATPKLGRNDPCHCGSGKKYKHCHGALA